MNFKLHWLKKIGLPLYFLSWISYFAFFWSRAFSYDELGNLSANHVNIWGDWAAHFTMGAPFAYREWWNTASPFLLNSRLSYPFVADLLSGWLTRLGVPFILAFTLPSFLTSCLMVVALYAFFKVIFNSQKIAILASLIFLLNGGLGFIYFGQDIATALDPLHTLLNPPHEYTRIDAEGIKWLSVIDSMMIPQRAFALGFPLAVIALTCVYQYFFVTHHKEIRGLKKRWPLGAAAIILGLMPIIHTHSFLASGIILSFWVLADILKHPKHWRQHLLEWGSLGGLILIIAIPLFGYFFAHQVAGFIKWYPGWLATEYDMNWFIFWFKNWGLVPVLAVLGFATFVTTFIPKSQKNWPIISSQMLIFTPFFLLFALANIFLFQPFSWDNTKLIVWASLGFSGLIGYFFAEKSDTFINKSVVVVLFAITIASGGIDAYWILRTDLHSFTMYTAEELSLADWTKKNTGPQTVWLTGRQHNHWLFNLTGRQAVMTYPGWLWTHGYEYTQTERDVQTMYRQPDALQLFQTYDIDYIVIGPQEKRDLLAQEEKFLRQFEKVKETQNYLILHVK